jgi:tetratricopeptide (TPR) repeat protein
VNAENAYLFRHALMRDAAYQLQLPRDRAPLHALAFAVIEELAGGPAPEPVTLARFPELDSSAHATDTLAHELAEHAQGAAVAAEPGDAAPLRKEYVKYLRRAADFAEKSFSFEAARARWQSLAGAVTAGDRPICLHKAAMAASRDGKPAVAVELCEEAIAGFREHGELFFEGVACADLGKLLSDLGRTEEAMDRYLKALVILRETGNRKHEGMTMGNLAILHARSGRSDEAERGLQEALRIHRDLGNRKSEGFVYSNLATLHFLAGRFGQAEQAYLEALAIHREGGNRRSEGVAMGNLAHIYASTGRLTEAEKTYEGAIQLHREVGDRAGEGVSLGNLGSLLAGTNRSELAVRTLGRALEIHRDVRHRHFEGIHSCDYALVLLDLGRLSEARPAWRHGVSILIELGAAPDLERKRRAMQLACESRDMESLEPTGL